MTTAFPAMPIRPRLCGPDVRMSVPLVDDQVRVCLTVNDGTQVRVVTEHDLRDWNVSFDTLLEVAVDALRRESAPSDWRPVDTVPGMAMLVTGDARASTRMLLIDELIGDHPLGGVVVVVPAHDQLMAVPLRDVEDLEAMNVMVSAAHFAWESSDQPLTNQAFWHDGQRWHRVDVEHIDDEVHIRPAPEMLNRINQLAAIGLVGAIAEA